MTPSAIVKKNDKISLVKDALDVAMEDIKGSIPGFLSPERLTKMFLSQCRKNPKLLNCDLVSLAKAFSDAGEVGLEPDGINAHLIPYGKEVNYMVDYKGMIKLARMSEEIADMTANVVYSNDVFEHEYGSNKHLKHIKFMGKKRGDRMCAYSYVKYKDGSEDFRVLTEAEIMHAKKSSKTGNIWASDPDPMWAKTAVRQHSKFLPKAKELGKATHYIESTELKEVTDSMAMTMITDSNKNDLTDRLAEKEEIREMEEGIEKAAEGASELADGDFRSELFDYAKKNGCEDKIPEVLMEMGFETIDDVDKDSEQMVLDYFKKTFKKGK